MTLQGMVEEIFIVDMRGGVGREYSRLNMASGLEMVMKREMGQSKRGRQGAEKGEGTMRGRKSMA